jgi:glutaminyl-peptide cyclotransferase
MSNKSKKKPIERETSPQRLMSRIVGLIAIALILVVIVAMWLRSAGGGEETVASNGPIIAQEVGYEVVNNFPHDPEAFLQGLVWHNGFFESTGKLGRSSLRRVEYPTGKVLQQVNLDSQYFGEGLAMVDNRLIQLTWQNRTAVLSMT